MSYAFVDRRCTACGGIGLTGTGKCCKKCAGTGLVGSLEDVPNIEYDGPSAVAHRLRLTRETKKVSMSELADQFGISVFELSDIERGRLEPIGELKTQIARWVYDGANF